jgi:long-subunit fatty acid transport protein
MPRIAIVILLALGLLAPQAAAQTKAGTTIAQFVGIEPSARVAAMGNAGVSLSDGIQSVHYNPGSLGMMTRTAFEFAHAFWFADIRYDYVAAAVSLEDWGNLFLSVTALNSGDIEVRTVSQPLGTGELYDVQDLAIGLGYGRAITHRFAAGVQVNYIAERIWHSTLDAWTISFGTTYQITPSGLTLGASILHFGTRGRYEGIDLSIQYDADPDRYGDNSALPADQSTDEFPVPGMFRVGLCYPRQLSATSKVLLTVDAFHPNDNTEGINLGWEWSWRDALMLRAGYQTLGQQDSDLGPTAGVGLRGSLGTHHYQLDYAWASHLMLPEMHRITFVLSL